MRKSIALLSVAFLLSSAVALGASTPSPGIKGLWLTADYPAATVRAGDEARSNLPLINEERPKATLTAEPKLPTLRGTPRSTFDFRRSTKNDSADASR